MVKTYHGSIFDSTAELLVCPVNCVGVMGKGLALEFKRRFPKLEAPYKQICKLELLPVGSASTIILPTGKPHVMVAFTKQHWRKPSRLDWVNGCLIDIAKGWNMLKFESIAIPQLGCGCGGLDWRRVEPLYHKHLGGLNCNVEIWVHDQKKECAQ